MEVGDLLKQSPLFAELSDGDIDILARSTRMETYQTGRVILREGRVGAAFYVLLSGRVEVVKGMGTAETVVVATFGAGDFFGEIATMKHVARSASVRALEETKCLVIRRLDLGSFIERFPELIAKVESALSTRADGRQAPE